MLNLVTPYPWHVEADDNGLRVVNQWGGVVAVIPEDKDTTPAERLANAHAIAGAARLLADARFLVDETRHHFWVVDGTGKRLVSQLLIDNLADAVRAAEVPHVAVR